MGSGDGGDGGGEFLCFMLDGTGDCGLLESGMGEAVDGDEEQDSGRCSVKADRRLHHSRLHSIAQQ